MTREDILNLLIKGCRTNEISDGYHTFEELYEHRIENYMALCKLLSMVNNKHQVWASTKHYDGSTWDGWFILGIDTISGKQISYHLPAKYWNEVCDFAEIFDCAPVWDGHTSEDVLKRLREL